MTTELMDERYAGLDLQSTQDILGHLHESQVRAVDSIASCIDELARAVDAAALKLADQQSRLVMVGAGASGRIAVQDGAELWPTYGWPAERLILEIAGGPAALLSSMDGIEDDQADAARCVKRIGLNQNDVVVAVAASGRTPWTCYWLEEAVRVGALAIGLSNNQDAPLLALAEIGLYLDSGAEVLAGSTRMAAGTAQKAALNLFSTALMVRLNRTYGNLMVDMAAVNSKLDGRRLSMLQAIVGPLESDHARKFLAQAEGNVKLACLLAKGASRNEAEAVLESHHGSLRDALFQLQK